MSEKFRVMLDLTADDAFKLGELLGRAWVNEDERAAVQRLYDQIKRGMTLPAARSSVKLGDYTGGE